MLRRLNLVHQPRAPLARPSLHLRRSAKVTTLPNIGATRAFAGSPPTPAEKNILTEIYGRLRQMFTSQSGTTGSSVLQFIRGGLPVDIDQLKNPWGLSNLNGDMKAAEALFRLTDAVPQINVDFLRSAESGISGVWETLLNSAQSDEKAPPDDQRQKKAYEFLYVDKKEVDFEGNETMKSEPTPIHKRFKANQLALVNAEAEYMEAYNQLDLNNVADQKIWRAKEPRLRLKKQQAFDKFTGEGSEKVQGALDALAAAGRSPVNAVITRGKQLLRGSLPSAAGNALPPWYLVECYPADWLDPNQQGLMEYKVTTEHIVETADSNFTAYSAKAGFQWGLWSASGSLEKSHYDSHESTDATKISISAKVGVVEIVRPWLLGELFRLKRWYTVGQPAGMVSSGGFSDNNKGLLPLIPVRFIIARDVTIKGDWSNKDKSIYGDKTKTSAGGGFGPFRIGGTYDKSHDGKTFTTSMVGDEIRIPGLQIIGFFSEVQPYAAPDNSP